MPFHPAIRPDDPNQPRFFPPLPPEMMRERFPNHMPPYRPHFHPRFSARPPPHYSPFSNDAGVSFNNSNSPQYNKSPSFNNNHDRLFRNSPPSQWLPPPPHFNGNRQENSQQPNVPLINKERVKCNCTSCQLYCDRNNMPNNVDGNCDVSHRIDQKSPHTPHGKFPQNYDDQNHDGRFPLKPDGKYPHNDDGLNRDGKFPPTQEGKYPQMFDGKLPTPIEGKFPPAQDGEYQHNMYYDHFSRPINGKFPQFLNRNFPPYFNGNFQRGHSARYPQCPDAKFPTSINGMSHNNYSQNINGISPQYFDRERTTQLLCENVRINDGGKTPPNNFHDRRCISANYYNYPPVTYPSAITDQSQSSIPINVPTTDLISDLVSMDTIKTSRENSQSGDGESDSFIVCIDNETEDVCLEGMVTLKQNFDGDISVQVKVPGKFVIASDVFLDDEILQYSQNPEELLNFVENAKTELCSTEDVVLVH